MPIRTVSQRSDRGKIKDLGKSNESESMPTTSELRMKRLYEFAQLNEDQSLQSALGFITTDYISDKNALPLSVYRIRKIVDDIKSKSAGKIDQLSQEITQYIVAPIDPAAQAYWDRKNSMAQIKTASARKPPIFWRARKS